MALTNPDDIQKSLINGFSTMSRGRSRTRKLSQLCADTAPQLQCFTWKDYASLPPGMKSLPVEEFLTQLRGVVQESLGELKGKLKEVVDGLKLERSPSSSMDHLGTEHFRIQVAKQHVVWLRQLIQLERFCRFLIDQQLQDRDGPTSSTPLKPLSTVHTKSHRIDELLSSFAENGAGTRKVHATPYFDESDSENDSDDPRESALNAILNHSQVKMMQDKAEQELEELHRRRRFEDINRRISEERMQTDLRKTIPGSDEAAPTLLAGPRNQKAAGVAMVQEILDNPNGVIQIGIDNLVKEVKSLSRHNEVWSRKAIPLPDSSTPSPLSCVPPSPTESPRSTLVERPSPALQSVLNRVPVLVDGMHKYLMQRVDGLSCGLTEFELLDMLENQVYPRIYDECFLAVATPDGDVEVRKSCQKWRDLTQAQLHIPKQYQSGEMVPYYEAIGKLRTLRLARSPSRKLSIIRAAAQSVFHNMEKAIGDLGLGDDEVLIGGDDFVPVFIYAVLKANIRGLASEVAFTYRYLNDSLVAGEAGYYLTTMELAVEYIRTITPDALNLDAEARLLLEIPDEGKGDFVASSPSPRTPTVVGSNPENPADLRSSRSLSILYTPAFDKYGLPVEDQSGRPNRFVSPHVERYTAWASAAPDHLEVVDKGVLSGYTLYYSPDWLLHPNRIYSCLCLPSPGSTVDVVVLRYTSETTEIQRLFLDDLFITPSVRGLQTDLVSVDTGKGRISGHLLVMTSLEEYTRWNNMPFKLNFMSEDIFRAREVDLAAPEPAEALPMRQIPDGKADVHLPGLMASSSLNAMGYTAVTDRKDVEQALGLPKSFDYLFFAKEDDTRVLPNLPLCQEEAPQNVKAIVHRVVLGVQRMLQFLALTQPLDHTRGVYCSLTQQAVVNFKKGWNGSKGFGVVHNPTQLPEDATLTPKVMSCMSHVVTEFARQLTAIGFSCTPGVEYHVAEEQVRRLQRSARLVVDGRMGRKTRTHLLNLKEATPLSAPHRSPPPSHGPFSRQTASTAT